METSNIIRHFANYENSKTLEKLGFEDTSFEFDWYLNFETKTPELKNWLESFKHNYRFESFVTAPLWQQVAEWLWTKHRISFVIDFKSDLNKTLHDILEKLENDDTSSNNS